MCRYIFGSLKNPFETALLKNSKWQEGNFTITYSKPSALQVWSLAIFWVHWMGSLVWDDISLTSPIWPLRLNLSETYLYRILRIAGAFAVRLYCAIKHMHFQTFNPSKFGSGVLDMVRKRELTKPKKLSFTLQIPPVQKDISNMKFPMHGMQFWYDDEASKLWVLWCGSARATFPEKCIIL